MNFKQALGKTIEKIEVVEINQKAETYDLTPLVEAARERHVKTIRFTFTDGSEDEISHSCD